MQQAAAFSDQLRYYRLVTGPTQEALAERMHDYIRSIVAIKGSRWDMHD